MKDSPLIRTVHWLPDRPEYLFLLFALPFGLIMLFLIPPLGGADEPFHFHRIASLAYFQVLNKPVMVSSGIVDFLKAGEAFFNSTLRPPFSYSLDEWHKVARIQDTMEMSLLLPNYVTVHHPFSYLPQIIAFRIGINLGLPPLAILYLVRFTGLISGIVLIFYAIRCIPSHKYILCAFALLPTMTVYRSYVNADVLTNGLAFLFTACVFRETVQQGKIAVRNIASLALIAFVLAQSKSAYLLLSFIVLAIPGSRFSDKRSHILALLFIIVPGIIASMAWMLLMKYTYFVGISYHTWGGDVSPDMQAAFMKAHPLEFAKILFRTLFLTSLLPMCILQMLGDVGPGYFLPAPAIVPLSFFIVAVILSDRYYSVNYNKSLRVLAAGIVPSVVIISLVILYMQWTGVGAAEVKGFQGRYFYPLLPLILPFLKPEEKVSMPLKPAVCIMLIALCGLVPSLWQIAGNYY